MGCFFFFFFFFCLLFLKPLDSVRVLVVKIGLGNLRSINKRTSLQGLESYHGVVGYLKLGSAGNCPLGLDLKEEGEKWCPKLERGAQGKDRLAGTLV